MIATLRLLNSYFWKTIYAPIISFIFPVLILGIVGNIFDIQYVLPGIIAMSTMFIAVLALPLAIMEIRESSLSKYIGASSVSPRKFSMAIILYYLLIIMISIFIVLISAMAIFPTDIFTGSNELIRLRLRDAKEMFELYSNTQTIVDSKVFVSQSIYSWMGTVGSFVSFLFANLLHIILCLSVGLLISTISKTPQQALTISLIVAIPSMFMSGMVISVDIMNESPAMLWISRVFPFRYTTGNIVQSTTPLNQLHLYYSDAQWDLLVDNQKLQAMIIEQEVPLMKFNSPSLFNFGTGFSVRRVPGVQQVRDFVEEFLGGETDLGGIDLTKDFEWMDVFTHLNSRLYTPIEKGLNILFPLLLTAGSLFYVHKKFRWTTR